MLRYQKIDVSEGIDINKTSASKECELCHYWFFKNIGFKFEEHVCNKCHDLLTIAYSLKFIAILPKFLCNSKHVIKQSYDAISLSFFIFISHIIYN